MCGMHLHGAHVSKEAEFAREEGSALLTAQVVLHEML